METLIVVLYNIGTVYSDWVAYPNEDGDLVAYCGERNPAISGIPTEVFVTKSALGFTHILNVGDDKFRMWDVSHYAM